MSPTAALPPAAVAGGRREPGPAAPPCVHCGGSGGTFFVPVPDDQVDADRRARAARVAERARELLPLQGPVRIVWCEPGTGPGNFHGDHYAGFTNPTVPGTIFLNIRHPHEDRVIYHEARHLWQYETNWVGPEIRGSAMGKSGQDLAREFDAAEWAGRAERGEAT